jgi:hypothetical protein
MVAHVVFKDNLEGRAYAYLVNDFKVSPMDKVLVPVGDHGHIEVATVVAVWANEVDYRYGDFPACRMKNIISPADRDELLKRMDAELRPIEEKYGRLLSKLG